jgi:hypothetical protein
VLDALPAHALAHFSCHGLQSQVSPDQSTLWLHDERLTMADLVELRLSGTLAFLSACDTAAGAVGLPDEAIHLAAAVQVAGFRHVVAALWPIVDDVTADLTVTFYQRLAAHDRIDASQTAAALHAAVDELKARFPRRPSVWGLMLTSDREGAAVNAAEGIAYPDEGAVPTRVWVGEPGLLTDDDQRLLLSALAACGAVAAGVEVIPARRGDAATTLTWIVLAALPLQAFLICAWRKAGRRHP